MKYPRHKYLHSALLLLGIYVLHFFLLDNFLNLSAVTRGDRAQYSSALVHHPHPQRHSGLAFFRMLEKHEGAKQSVSVPAADMSELLLCIVLFIREQPAAPVACCGHTDILSPSSYRLYLQDRVFRI